MPKKGNPACGISKKSLVMLLRDLSSHRYFRKTKSCINLANKISAK